MELVVESWSKIFGIVVVQLQRSTSVPAPASASMLYVSVEEVEPLYTGVASGHKLFARCMVAGTEELNHLRL